MKLPSPEERWRLVLVLALVQGLTGSLCYYGLPVYLEALTSSGRFSPAVVAGGTALYFIAMSVWSVPLGRIVVRVRIAVVVAGGSAAFVAAQVLLALGSRPWHLVLAYVLLALATCACGPVPLTTLVLRWFPDRPRAPVAVTLSGQTIGGALVLPVIIALVRAHGLPTVLFVCAGLHLVVVGGLAVRYLWTRDSGIPALPPRSAGAARLRRDLRPADPRDRRQVLRTMVPLCVAAVCTGAALTGVLTHLYAMGTSRGIPAAAAALSLAAFSGLVIRLSTVRVLDRLGSGFLIVSYAGGLLAALVIILFARSSFTLLSASVLLGFTSAAAPVLFPALVVERLGVLHYAPRVGLITGLSSLSSAAGTFGVEVLRSSAGYDFAYAVLLVPASLGAVAFALAGRYPRNPPLRAG